MSAGLQAENCGSRLIDPPFKVLAGEAIQTLCSLCPHCLHTQTTCKRTHTQGGGGERRETKEFLKVYLDF